MSAHKYVCIGNECCSFGIDGSPNYTNGVEMVVYVSGDIGDVFVKAESKSSYRSYSDIIELMFLINLYIYVLRTSLY